MIKRLPTSIALAAILAAPVWAAEPHSWLDDMASMEAQIKILRKQEELRAERARAASNLSPLPKIVAIHEFGGRAKAKLLHEDGRLETVGENDYIGQGVRIAAITARGVMVVISRKGKKETMTELLFTPIATAGSTQQGKGPEIPAALLPPPPPVNFNVAAPTAPAQPTPQPK